ncbi:MAG: fused MFS/spermidine synthase [Ignavibacteriae bacterium]|nr:fused MFS/spermidine synthase [Ignavibacteriota bacterium]
MMQQEHEHTEPKQSGVTLLFALTIFSGAFLLFLVQPLIGKYILPWFGGSQAVWTTCLLFFQVFLLVGYTYAHLLTKWLQRRRQALLHIGLLILSLLFLPVIPSEFWKPTPESNPTWQIITLLTASIGLPYVLLSATSPLIQRWFTYVKTSSSPYRLFALSNVGSLLALVIFPLLLEPSLSRNVQAIGWSWGMGLFALVCSLCAVYVWRSKMNPTTVNTSTDAVVQTRTLASDEVAKLKAPDVRTRTLWFALPASASIMLLATTNKLCQDIAVVPFLWVVPLILYLLSFVICFDKPSWYSRLWFGIGLVLGYAAVIVVLLMRQDPPLLLSLTVFPVVLFVACMVCHGELVRLKPEPHFLTSYYLSIATGGAIGGVFVAIVAPIIFDDYSEFQVGLLVCVLLMLIVLFSDKQSVLYNGKPRWAWALIVVGVMAFGYELQEVRSVARQYTINNQRNFYGTLSIAEYGVEQPKFLHRTMRHGKILHGLQYLSPQFQQLPTAYFTYKSGIGFCLRNLPKKDRRRIGVIGLGVGTLAAWAGPDDYIRFYELNPDVQQLAKQYFTYLTNCRGKVDVVLGDARLSLENESPQEFDVLVLDAFNSDTPPVHLLTKEAFDIYRRHLKPEGVLALHITCKYIDFYPVVAALAEHAGYRWAYIVDYNREDEFFRTYSKWVLVTNNETLLTSDEIIHASSYPTATHASDKLWTDDYTSLFQVLTW